MASRIVLSPHQEAMTTLVWLIGIFLLLIDCTSSTPTMADAEIMTEATVDPPVTLVTTTGGLLWKNMSVTTASSSASSSTTTTSKSSTTLLHSCSGFIPNGHVCAILGPSGSGKSTLLAALAGRSHQHHTTVHGQVTYYTDDERTIRGDASSSFSTVSSSPDPRHVAWLSQVDVFFSLLTPRETLNLAAFLELPHWNDTARHTLVQRHLDSLGLQNVADQMIAAPTLQTTTTATNPKKRRNSQSRGWWSLAKWRSPWTSSLNATNNATTTASLGASGGGGGGWLSGGERRRLSVAVELLSHSSSSASSELWYWMADEPTSGLDASLAVTVLYLIRQQTKARHIPTLTSLHQPRSSVWQWYMDDVILLAPGGHVCYCGPVDQCLPYFANLGYPCPNLTNPAEFLVDLVSLYSPPPLSSFLHNNSSNNGSESTHVNDESWTSMSERQQIVQQRIDFLARSFADYQNKHWSDPDIVRVEQEQRRKQHHDQDTVVRAMPISRDDRSMGQKRFLPKFIQRIPQGFRRWAALWRRSWRQTIRNRPLHIFRFLASLGNAVLLSKVFPSILRNAPPLASSVADRVALLSFGAITMAFLAFLNTVTIFAKERVRNTFNIPP